MCPTMKINSRGGIKVSLEFNLFMKFLLARSRSKIENKWFIKSILFCFLLCLPITLLSCNPANNNEHDKQISKPDLQQEWVFPKDKKIIPTATKGGYYTPYYIVRRQDQQNNIILGYINRLFSISGKGDFQWMLDIRGDILGLFEFPQKKDCIGVINNTSPSQPEISVVDINKKDITKRIPLKTNIYNIWEGEGIYVYRDSATAKYTLKRFDLFSDKEIWSASEILGKEDWLNNVSTQDNLHNFEIMGFQSTNDYWRELCCIVV